MVSLIKQRRDLALGIGAEVAPKKLNQIEDLSLDRYAFNPNFDLKLDERITEMSSAICNDAGEPILPRGCLGRIVTEYRTCLVGGISDLNPPRLQKMPIYAGYIAQGIEAVYGKLGIQEIAECKGFPKVLVGEVQDVICPDIPESNYEWLELLDAALMRDWIAQQRGRITELAAKYDIGDLYVRVGKVAERMRKCVIQNLEYVNDYVALEIGSLQQGRNGVPGNKVVLDAVDKKFFALLGKTIPEQYLTFDPKDDQGTLVKAVAAGVKEAMGDQPSGNMDMAAMAAAFIEAVKAMTQAPQQTPQAKPEVKNDSNQKK